MESIEMLAGNIPEPEKDTNKDSAEMLKALYEVGEQRKQRKPRLKRKPRKPRLKRKARYNYECKTGICNT